MTFRYEALIVVMLNPVAECPGRLLPLLRARRSTLEPDDEGHKTFSVDSFHYALLGSGMHNDGPREQLRWTHGCPIVPWVRRGWSFPWVRWLQPC